MANLVQALDTRILVYRQRNRWNYGAAFVLTLTAVAISGLTVICIALDLGSRQWLAALAAIPGVLVLVNQTFKFDAKANWYWQKRLRLQAIQKRHAFENLSMEDASRAWREVDAEMVDQWPGFGMLPTPRIVARHD